MFENKKKAKTATFWVRTTFLVNDSQLHYMIVQATDHTNVDCWLRLNVYVAGVEISTYAMT